MHRSSARAFAPASAFTRGLALLLALVVAFATMLLATPARAAAALLRRERATGSVR